MRVRDEGGPGEDRHPGAEVGFPPDAPVARVDAGERDVGARGGLSQQENRVGRVSEGGSGVREVADCPGSL
ncbi:hypothetical protein ACX31A_15245 [Dermacoccus nishinomiyaensis]